MCLHRTGFGDLSALQGHGSNFGYAKMRRQGILAPVLKWYSDRDSIFQISGTYVLSLWLLCVHVIFVIMNRRLALRGGGTYVRLRPTKQLIYLSW